MIGVILGTLGRQGSTSILFDLLAECNIPYFVLLLSEITPDKLKKFEAVDAWIQVACPRLSIDWGHHFETPLLNSYEGHVLLSNVDW